MRALTGDSMNENYRRLYTTPRGGRIAYQRVELARKLMDDAWLCLLYTSPSPRDS